MKAPETDIRVDVVLKNGYIERLTPEDYGYFVHFFSKKEIVNATEVYIIPKH